MYYSAESKTVCTTVASYVSTLKPETKIDLHYIQAQHPFLKTFISMKNEDSSLFQSDYPLYQQFILLSSPS